MLPPLISGYFFPQYPSASTFFLENSSVTKPDFRVAFCYRKSPIGGRQCRKLTSPVRASRTSGTRAQGADQKIQACLHRRRLAARENPDARGRGSRRG